MKGFFYHGKSALSVIIFLLFFSWASFAQTNIDEVQRKLRRQNQQLKQQLSQTKMTRVKYLTLLRSMKIRNELPPLNTLQPHIQKLGHILIRGSTLYHDAVDKSHKSLTPETRSTKSQMEHHQRKVVESGGLLASGTAISAAGKTGVGLSSALMILKAGKDLRDIYQVGKGRASPEQIRHIIPHVVMAWDKMKGPMNLPKVDFFTRVEGQFLEPGNSIKVQGNIKGTRTFSSTSPRFLSLFGWDPMTDSITTTVDSYMKTTTNFSGKDWNIYAKNITGLSPTSTANELTWTVYTKYHDSDIYRSTGVHYRSPIVPSNTTGTGWNTFPSNNWNQSYQNNSFRQQHNFHQIQTYRPPTFRNF